jgi:hypothetical protein
MMGLTDRVHIARRFQRSIRIDTDLGDAAAVEGFICPRSSADVLLNMSRHIVEGQQGAFTWTGPYGAGKSSLVVALSALLNGDAELRKKAAKTFGRETTATLWKRLPIGKRGWRILPVVGRRDHPVAAIGDALDASGLAGFKRRTPWTEKRLIDSLSEIATRGPNNYGGLVLFIDEMGKFLEAAAQDGTDIYLFQQLAETASRSHGRLILIGVLHQAFEEYAHRLSHQMRDEWAKIQGRFVDLAINTAAEEQIHLLSRAIESTHKPNKPANATKTVARIARRERTDEAERLAATLQQCWPLSPVVASLLGPISRRRFGQNQRSIFGFLNSAEPHGFQDFLRRANMGPLYEADRLWDYLRVNLEPSILASPDGHRWALAAEALERCESLGGDDLHLRVLKTIAVVDLFKERSGLVPSFDLLHASFPECGDAALAQVIERLTKWSLIVFKKFLDSYAVFAGSDFDIDRAVREALEHVHEIDFAALKALAGLQPIVAKRHYHETGALRWFDVNVVSTAQLERTAAKYKADNSAIGQFLLAIPAAGETGEEASERCREAARRSDASDVIVGLSPRAWGIVELARELIASENVRNDRPELAGDRVARREVDARLATLQAQLETELRRAFDSATWFRKHHQPKTWRHAELNGLASELADDRFGDAPRLHNELLNRQEPSSSAIKGQNTLLRAMVMNEGQPRLGIVGYPAEGGLLASILEDSRLYAETEEGWRFLAPKARTDKDHRLAPMWAAAETLVKKNATRIVSVKEMYELWRTPPFGVKDGLMPILAVAFILSQRDKIAVYREGIFRAKFDDVDVDYLGKDPGMIQLRWMTLSDVSRKLLSAMAEVVRRLDASNSLVHLEPIDVARGLVAIHDQLPEWTKRTTRLSANAVRVRNLFKQARDPNKFLFDDIPENLGRARDLANDSQLRQVVGSVSDGLEELARAYPSMLHRLRDVTLAELQVPDISPQSLAELRDRAANIQNLAGDFRLEAFVNRIALFEGTDAEVEAIGSLAADKPSRDWSDSDIDRATIELADMAQKFIRVETFARVKNRNQKRDAMAVVVGLGGRPAPLLEEFAIGDADRAEVNELIARVTAAVEAADASRRSIILAALAEMSARYMQPATDAKPNGREGSHGR